MIRKVCADEEAWAHVVASGGAVVKSRALAHRTTLTAREWDVFTLMYRGYSNNRIGETLCVSPDTVKTHVRCVLKKLEAANRKELFG